jgi:hydrophobic/amphiphilic exporter-1 (mainly G- bacteria), HAE1 family
VLLKDVGHSVVGAEDYSTSLKVLRPRCNGHRRPAAFERQCAGCGPPGKAALARTLEELSAGPEYAIAFDSTTVVGDSIREVMVTLAKPSSSSSR